MLPRYPRQLQDFTAALPVCHERVRPAIFLLASLFFCALSAERGKAAPGVRLISWAVLLLGCGACLMHGFSI